MNAGYRIKQRARVTLTVKILATVIIFSGFAVAPGTVTSAMAAATHQTASASRRYKIVVDGLACPFCAYGLEKHLHEISGVQNTQTDIASETITVTMAPGKGLDKAAAAHAVKDAGFTMYSFEEVPPAGRATP